MTATLEKRPLDIGTYTVRPEGALAGHEFVMRPIASRDWIRMRSGELDNLGLLEAALNAVVDHSVDLDDLGALPPAMGLELVAAWVRAHREAALPPTNGSS